jgi:HD-GYP domain-containing protein (c-di-GMP phosphodiesterase class II)
MLHETRSLGEIALDIVLHHHEKLRGRGYPDGLDGRLISPFVRMVTIADIFDALTTERSFQRARSTFEALSIMRVEIGHDIDANLFRAFVAMMGGAGAS